MTTSSNAHKVWLHVPAALLAIALQSGCGSGHASDTTAAQAMPPPQNSKTSTAEIETADNASRRASLLH